MSEIKNGKNPICVYCKNEVVPTDQDTTILIPFHKRCAMDKRAHERWIKAAKNKRR